MNNKIFKRQIQTITGLPLLLGPIQMFNDWLLEYLSIELWLGPVWCWIFRYSANIQKIFDRYSTNIWQIFKKYSANIQQIFEKYSRNIWQIFNKYLTNIETVRGFPLSPGRVRCTQRELWSCQHQNPGLEKQSINKF